MLGLADIHEAWKPLSGFTGTTQSASAVNSRGMGVASLQQPNASQLAQMGLGTPANIPGINSVEMPSWLQTNPDSSMQELLDSYSGIQAAYDPTDQVNARNNAIAYNTSMGGQAANNAATEYSNRAAQSGASGLGAGVVKAQAMMPVLAQNAALKTDAADIAAKAHQEAAGLAAQVASTIGNLRTNYLQTLTGYAQGQQALALDKYRAEQSAAAQAAQLGLGYAQLNAQQYQQQLAQKAQTSEQARLAAMGLLQSPKPTGNYVTNNQGNVTSGLDTYNQIKNWSAQQTAARNKLASLLM